MHLKLDLKEVVLIIFLILLCSCFFSIWNEIEWYGVELEYRSLPLPRINHGFPAWNQPSTLGTNQHITTLKSATTTTNSSQTPEQDSNIKPQKEIAANA